MHKVQNKELKTIQNKIKKDTELIESHIPTKYKKIKRSWIFVLSMNFCSLNTHI